MEDIPKIADHDEIFFFISPPLNQSGFGGRGTYFSASVQAKKNSSENCFRSKNAYLNSEK